MTHPKLSTNEPEPVLFVAFQSGRLANGGIQSLTEILGRLRRVRPILLTQIESPITERWRASGYEVHVWPFPWPRSRAAPLAPRVRRIARDIIPLVAGNVRMIKFLREHRIRVVHCNDGWASLIVAPSARAAGARVLLNIRDTVLKGKLRWMLMRALSDRVIVLSEEMHEIVARRLDLPVWALGIRPTPIHSVYSIVDTAVMHPVPLDQRAFLRKELGIRETDEVAVGIVGALVPKKQQLELIRHISDNPEQLPDKVTLFFIGDFAPATDAYCRLCEEAAKRGPLRERIRFVGYSSKIAQWYQALDITLMVSRFEGLARGMIESVACGTPVVAFDFCSAREVLEQHECGFVVPQGDFEQLMSRMSQLARDQVLRRRLGRAGPELARQHFAPELIAARYEDVYLELGAEARKATVSP